MDATFGAFIFLGILALIFIGMSFSMGRQTSGRASSSSTRIGNISENLAIIIPIAIILIATLFAGFEPW